MTTEVVAPADGDIDRVVVRQVPTPAPGPGQVLVSVRAVGVNPTDWKSMHRTWPRSTPMLLGYEAAGVVGALGPEGDDGLGVAVGDKVIAYPVLGAYATDLIVPAGAVLAMPATLDFPEAANLLLVGTTAAEMLAVADIRQGETVLVHGGSSATGVSLLQQLAPLHSQIVATASAANFDLVRRFGAQPVAYGPGLSKREGAAAPGGIDAALDCVGTDEAIAVSVELVADRDRIVTIANAEKAANSASVTSTEWSQPIAPTATTSGNAWSTWGASTFPDSRANRLAMKGREVDGKEPQEVLTGIQRRGGPNGDRDVEADR